MNAQSVVLGGRKSQCAEVKADGQRCRANAITASPFCFFHSRSPEIAEKRKRARKLGGYRTRGPVLPPDTADVEFKTIGDVLHLLAETTNHVRKGRLDPKLGTVLARLAQTALTALGDAKLEERVAALEAKTAEGP